MSNLNANKMLGFEKQYRVILIALILAIVVMGVIVAAIVMSVMLPLLDVSTIG